MRRGAIWWANLPEPWGRRPVLLLSRDEAYRYLNAVVVAPLTTRVRGIASEVPLDPEHDGVPKPCAANFDNLQQIRKELLDSPIAMLSPAKIAAADRALHFALNITNCPSRSV